MMRKPTAISGDQYRCQMPSFPSTTFEIESELSQSIRKQYNILSPKRVSDTKKLPSEDVWSAYVRSFMKRLYIFGRMQPQQRQPQY